MYPLICTCYLVAADFFFFLILVTQAAYNISEEMQFVLCIFVLLFSSLSYGRIFLMHTRPPVSVPWLCITEACRLGFLFTFFVVTMNPKFFVGDFQLSSIHCNIYLPMTSWLCFAVRNIYFPFYSGFKGLYDCSVWCLDFSVHQKCFLTTL